MASLSLTAETINYKVMVMGWYQDNSLNCISAVNVYSNASKTLLCIQNLLSNNNCTLWEHKKPLLYIKNVTY